MSPDDVVMYVVAAIPTALGLFSPSTFAEYGSKLNFSLTLFGIHSRAYHTAQFANALILLFVGEIFRSIFCFGFPQSTFRRRCTLDMKQSLLRQFHTPPNLSILFFFFFFVVCFISLGVSGSLVTMNPYG